jgi:hypothetical protein
MSGCAGVPGRASVRSDGIRVLTHEVTSAILLKACPHGTVLGRLPEWPKGAVCKTVGSAYASSNLAPATIYNPRSGPLRVIAAGRLASYGMARLRWRRCLVFSLVRGSSARCAAPGPGLLWLRSGWRSRRTGAGVEEIQTLLGQSPAIAKVSGLLGVRGGIWLVYRRGVLTEVSEPPSLLVRPFETRRSPTRRGSAGNLQAVVGAPYRPVLCFLTPISACGLRIGGADRDSRARRAGTGCQYSDGYCPAWRDLRTRT